MRIIITDKGNLLQKVLNEEIKIEKDKQDKIKHGLIQNILSPLSRNKINHYPLEPTVSGKLKKKGFRYRSFDYSLIRSPITSNKIKYINVNEKVVIPKNDLDKYNNETSLKIFLPKLPENIVKNHEKIVKDLETNFEKKSISELESMNGVYSLNYLPVKELINKSSYNKLLEEIGKEEKLKRKLKHVNNLEFRTPDREKSRVKEIQENVNKIIDLKNVDLINYLHEKKELPERLLTNLQRFDEEQISIANKICQKVVSNKIIHENFLKNLKENIEFKNGKQAEEKVNSMFNSCEVNENCYNNILNNYSKEKPRYDGLIVEYHREIKNNYWEKFNAKHLQRVRNKSNRETISSVTKNEHY